MFKFIKKMFKGSKRKRSHLRSMLKALSWRCVASTDTLLIVWFMTGSFSMGAGISIIEIFTKIVLFYSHERMWNNFR